jgi:hypothetical protein
MVAVSCRNLLEINIFTKYAFASQNNVLEFNNDIWVDGKQIFEHLRNWIQYVDPVRKIPELDQTIANFDAELKHRVITRTTPLRIRDLAELTGMLAEFEAMNKVASKLVHATALSVLAYKDTGEQRLVLDYMVSRAIGYCADICRTIQQYVETQ